MDGWIEYLILIVLVAINAFFAASELAIVSTRKTRIQQLADEGSSRARTVLRLTNNPRRFLATIQVGITLAGFFASAFGAVSLVKVFEALFKQVEFLSSSASTLAFILVTVLIAFITLIFGELVPKTLAVEAAETVALTVARPIEIIARLTAPIVFLLTTTTNFIVHLLGGKRNVEAASVSRQEIVAMVAEGSEEGIFEPEEQTMVRNLFGFNEKKVREVMVPRMDALFVDAESLIAAIAPEINESGYSRYPAYSGQRENIIGIVYAKDVLRAFSEGTAEQMKVREILREAYFVPGSTGIDELLRQLQKSRTHIALIVDEYGGIDGLVTLEDILEELVGDIQDEFDHEEGIVTKVAENEYLVLGSAGIFEVNQQLELELGEESGEGATNVKPIEADTIGGLVMESLNRIPRLGDELTLHTVHFGTLIKAVPDEAEAEPETENKIPATVTLTVQEMRGLRVTKVLLKIKPDMPERE